MVEIKLRSFKRKLRKKEEEVKGRRGHCREGEVK